MRRQRLGILLNGGHLGGPGRYVRSLLKGIDRDEFEVVLFGGCPELCAGSGAVRREPLGEEPSPRPSPGVPGEGDREECSPRSCWGGPGEWAKRGRGLAPFAVKYWMGFERVAQRLAQVLRRCPVDLLHTNETGCEESAVAARLAGVGSVVGTFHVLPDVDVQERQGRWVHRQLERRSVRAMDVGIAVSEAGRQAWLRRAGLSPDRIVTIHNGIDVDDFRRSRGVAEARRELGIRDDGSIIVGTAARLEPVKGLAHLIEAVARLRGRGVGVRLVIAGKGSLEGELRRRAAEAGIGGEAHFVGFREDVRVVMEALDVFVLPSLSEALPYVVMEAMAMELPVVASDVGGVGEIVGLPGQGGGLCGLLVKPGVADELAQAILMLWSSSELRRRMGRAGRERVERCFDEREMVRRTVGVYRGLLRERRACA